MFTNLIDKQFEKLGYRITECYQNSVTYEKRELIGNYIHVIHIFWNRPNNTFIVQSYEAGVNSDKFNNVVGLKQKEVLLIYLRMWFM